MSPCPFCGERFTTPYKYGSVYACQTLVLTSKSQSRTFQTKECLRGEVVKLKAENAALVERVKRIESAADKLAARHLLVPTTYPQAQKHVAEYHKEKATA